MARVKMNAKHEYEFIANFKVLQNVFKAKKVEKVCGRYIAARRIVPNILEAHSRRKTRKMQNAVRPTLTDHSVIRLISIRDNLEFLQWIKRFWDQNYQGHGYDPVSRRRGAPTDTPVTIAPLAPTHRGGLGPSLGTAGGIRAGGRTPISGHRSASTQPNEAIQALQAQLKEMSTHMEGLEKERDFYFAKVRSTLSRCGDDTLIIVQLRDIEILVQQELELPGREEIKESDVLKEIQKILYSTEVRPVY